MNLILDTKATATDLIMCLSLKAALARLRGRGLGWGGHTHMGYILVSLISVGDKMLE